MTVNKNALGIMPIMFQVSVFQRRTRQQLKQKISPKLSQAVFFVNMHHMYTFYTLQEMSILQWKNDSFVYIGEVHGPSHCRCNTEQFSTSRFYGNMHHFTFCFRLMSRLVAYHLISLVNYVTKFKVT